MQGDQWMLVLNLCSRVYSHRRVCYFVRAVFLLYQLILYTNKELHGIIDDD